MFAGQHRSSPCRYAPRSCYSLSQAHGAAVVLILFFISPYSIFSTVDFVHTFFKSCSIFLSGNLENRGEVRLSRAVFA